MAKIELSELNFAGSELLQNSESFLDELSDREIENLVGGDTINSVVSNLVVSRNTVTVGTVNTATDVCQTQSCL
jgi:hypothetical protein